MNCDCHEVRTSNAATVALMLLTLPFVCAGAIPAQAQTPAILYSFLNGSSDAACPSGNIVQGRDGNMYGVGAACGRGANTTGTVYKITPASNFLIQILSVSMNSTLLLS